MNLTLHIWRQAGPNTDGRMVTTRTEDISPEMSFLEMLDVVNERFTDEGKEPVAFDSDCREGRPTPWQIIKASALLYTR